MRRKYFFQQNDTKINDFDEGVSILEPCFWGQCHIKNVLLLYQKSRLRWGGISLCSFPGIVALQSYVLINAPECFSLFMLSSFFKARADTLYYPGEPNNGNFRYVSCNFWDRRGKFLTWHCLRRTAIEWKRLHQKLWSWCHFAKKRILYALMHTTFSFCPSFSLNYWS